MASKKTITKKAVQKKPAKAATKKKVTKAKVEAKAAGPRHPKARVTEAHGGKEALAKALAGSLVRGDEDAGGIADRLKTASNAQLLHLQHVVETVKKKWGSREKLIAALSAAERKTKDADYITKLGTFSLPHLVDLASTADRHARA